MAEEKKSVEKSKPEMSAPEPDPKPVKLDRPKDRTGKPEDTIPVAPVAAEGKVPRVIHQNERAPKGLKRFSFRCKSPLLTKKYLLAKDRIDAEACYLKSVGFTKEHDLPLIVVELVD